jgi:hypothetical protein
MMTMLMRFGVCGMVMSNRANESVDVLSGGLFAITLTGSCGNPGLSVGSRQDTFESNA